MTAHLAPGGRMVLLEAAPTRPASHCDTSIFRARLRSEYLELFRECGLRVRAITGVDPAPFKYQAAAASEAPAATAGGRGDDRGEPAVVAHRCSARPVCGVHRSWHAVFVLESRADRGGRHHA